MIRILLACSVEGRIFVLAASTQFQLIATNDMGEHTKASLAPSDGQLFIRTYENLYSVGRRR